ncbi:MAG: MurR/RpiR family transcriptional regulator [Pseudomonas sp.]|uniref:MurR/RpiR family transcriptional regulator n=1 Tax=Pseudomonas abieticivorans TaxID=2931382 RepID=UPI0020BF2243|nr:MurR/RpiR family transcriptional regulator [Pseudomonas sp. PIA16]MDE1167975.1 MurR/RpiR family transcriptional regulator [Pseudomonas sp.]
MLKSSGNTVYDTQLMLKLRELAPKLKPALRANAEFILRNPLRSATLNIEEIAKETQTSTAAVNRLSNALGLETKGFTGLRKALVENLLELLSPVDKVHAELLHNPEKGFCLEQQVRLSKGNLDAVLNNNDDQTFSAMGEQLSQCQRAFVLGCSTSHHLALMASDLLLAHCRDVQVINPQADAEQTAYRLASIGRSDVLLVIDLPPYFNETQALATFAREQGATVLAISDSPASKLVDIATHCLFASTLHPVLAQSRVAVLSVIEGLGAALRMRHQAPVNDVAERASQVLSQLNTGARAAH